MVAHNCHGKTKNLTAKTKTSRQNQKPQLWFCRGYWFLPSGICLQVELNFFHEREARVVDFCVFCGKSERESESEPEMRSEGL